MLYEMLAGRVAFPAPTEYARLAAVLNTTPPPLESIDPQLSRLSPFVQLAMQKDRAQRFQNALEMARALAGAIGVDAASPSGGPTPLSRLPEVPSVWAPAAGPSPVAHSGPTIAQHTPSGLESVVAIPPTTPVKGPGGTLASRDGRDGVKVSERPPPQIPIVGATAGTMPSEHLPMLAAGFATGRRGVATWLVVVLVLGALAAGFLLGFAAARMH
jgi:serine/threonine protein kinase